MPLARDLSDLPRDSGSEGDDTGWPPDATPRFGPILVERWHAKNVYVPRARPEARFRHSHAGACARAIAYAALDLPPSDPMDKIGSYITRLGTIMHEALQEAIQERYPGALIEAEIGQGDRAGHIDVKLGPTTIEAKSVDGYAFKLAVGDRNPPLGPRHGHVLQASLNGYDAGSEEVVLLYLARGVIAQRRASDRDRYERAVAEWTLPRDKFVPLAETEIARIEGILALLDQGILAARKIPDPELPGGHLVTRPKTGEWRVVDAEGQLRGAGHCWQCNYCAWQQVCSSTDSGRQSVEVLTEIGAR